MKNEIEYENMQELQGIGEHVNECMNAILQDNDEETLGGLQMSAYKYTDAGISVSFQLDDGTYIWVGDDKADDPNFVGRVQKIGFSSIIEGSESEISLIWLDLLEIETPEQAVSEYNRLVQETNDLACDLWEEVNNDLH